MTAMCTYTQKSTFTLYIRLDAFKYSMLFFILIKKKLDSRAFIMLNICSKNRGQYIREKLAIANMQYAFSSLSIKIIIDVIPIFFTNTNILVLLKYNKFYYKREGRH